MLNLGVKCVVTVLRKNESSVWFLIDLSLRTLSFNRFVWALYSQTRIKKAPSGHFGNLQEAHGNTFLLIPSVAGDGKKQKDIYLLLLVNVCERSNLTVFVGTKDFAQGAGGYFTVQTIDIDSLIFMLFTHWQVTLFFRPAKESKFKTNLVS